MDTMLYDEPTLLTAVKKTSLSMDNSSLKLNLYPDGKNLDITAKNRDDLGFGDLADFLVSPDIGISSPDLENLVWKEWSNTLKTPGGLSEQQIIKQEHCDTQSVTKEQEVFAFGFTEALKKLQQTEQVENEVNQADEIAGDSSEFSDSGSPDDSSLIPEDCDPKITYISYTFDSNERLPPFQEAFSKFIIKKSKDLEFCLQIKMEASEDVPVGEQEKANDKNEFKNWNNDCSSKDVWDRVETVDEGFCIRGEMPVDLERHTYLEDSAISDCAMNSSLSWEHSNDFATNNSDFYKQKSTVDRHLLGDFNPNNCNDENYTGEMANINDMAGNIDDHSRAQWMATHNTL